MTLSDAEQALAAALVKRTGFSNTLAGLRRYHQLLSTGERAVLDWLDGDHDPELLTRVDDDYRKLMEAVVG